MEKSDEADHSNATHSISADSGVYKRRRALVACSSCRRRKIRCDSARPNCGNCTRAGLECVYSSGRRKKIKPHDSGRSDGSSSTEQQLNSRLERLEAMLGMLLEKQGVSPKDKESVTNRSSLSPDSSLDYSLSSDSSDDANEEGDLNDDTYDHEDASPSDAVTNVDRQDIFQLNERRAPVIVKLGDLEPLVAYNYGFTPSLLSPKSMRWLCESIGNHTLGVQAEAILSRLWKQKTGKLLDWGKLFAQPRPLNPEIIKLSLHAYSQSDSQILHSLINPQDLAIINKMCCSSGEFNTFEKFSPYSVVYSTIVMCCTQQWLIHIPKDLPFTEEQIREQNKIAFNFCMKNLSLLSWAPTTFLLLRILLLSIYAISQNVLFPQLRGLIAQSIYMALNLGLHCPEGSRKLNVEERERRSIVWAMIHDLDLKTASSFSLVPLLINCEYIPKRIQIKEGMGDDVDALRTAMELDRIYLKVHYKLFSRKAQKTSVKTMLLKISQLDAKLNHWKDNLPEAFLETLRIVDLKESGKGECPHGREDRYEKVLSKMKVTMCIQLSSMVCYYNIMMLIHSIPAFSPSCLNAFEKDEVPPRLLYSLAIVSESAQSILKLSFNLKEITSDECLAFFATNSFSALFLKQIRDPRHPTNADELTLIYRYITRFKGVAESMSPMDSQHIMNVWLIFANALTQLNREYPSVLENAPARNSNLPTGLNMQVPVYESPQTHPQAQAKHEKAQDSHAQYPSQQHPQPPQSQQPTHLHASGHSHVHPPGPHDYAPPLVPPAAHTNGTAHPPIQPSTLTPPTPLDVMMDQNTFQKPVGAYNSHVNGLVVPGNGVPEMYVPSVHPGNNTVPVPEQPHGPHMQPLSPSGLMKQPFTDSNPTPGGAFMDQVNRNMTPGHLGHRGENTLWETFSGINEIDVAFNEDELLNGFDQSIGKTDFDHTPNTCIIC